MSHQIIALWTHPRSISTAMERVMMERGDLNVLHEPFSYLYYVHENGSAISQQFIDPDHPRTYPEIKEHILAAAEEKPVFFKDMCSHCFDYLKEDEQFLDRLTNTFLIRDPAKAIASYYAMNSQVKKEEIGLEQAFHVFNRVKQIEGDIPPVVDADDLEDHPEKTVEAYCQSIDIPFIPESLYWDSGHKEEWEIWKDWHADAAKSSGIQKDMETFEVTVDNSKLLKSYYDNQFPFYEGLHEHRLNPAIN